MNKVIGTNELIKQAGSVAEVQMLGNTHQDRASAKTLRRRQRLVKRRLAELEKGVVPSKTSR